MQEPIPSFDAPPVNEVVMGFQFHPIRMRVQSVMEYWSSIKDRYPKIVDQAPLPHQKESSDQNDRIQFAVGNYPPPRYWMIDHPGNELIQIQLDKFLRNWRQLKGDETYPRFERLFESFMKDWVFFNHFVQESNLGEIQLDLCELTYINQIEPDQTWKGFSGLPDVFSFLKRKDRPFLPPPELFNWESAYLLPDGKGRLIVEVSPGIRQRDFKTIVCFTLSARGIPSDTSEEANIAEWFRSAHDLIVRGFDELTTPVMHTIWKKKP